MSNIFISHSSEDNEVAKALKRQLEEWGHRSIFLDVDKLHGIKAGTDWEKVLYYNLRACQAVIILCSYASMGSRWVFAEVTIANFQGKQLFPIMIGDLKDRKPFSILTQTQFFNPDAEFAPEAGPDYDGLRIG
ncbi:MAG: toll/interleukin-1 receptor domain-containing protein, partial [Cyanobacteria bacterium P01_F01_bin.86]